MSSNIRRKGRGVNRIITSKVMLSPLAGVTDNIFRRLVRKWAPNSLLFTEMINATGLKKGFGKQKINQIDLEEGPIGVQIFDNRPNAVSEAAKQAEAFTFIGAIKIIIGRKIDTNINKKKFPFKF